MRFSDFLQQFGQEPLIRSSWLATIGSSPARVGQTLTRWVKQGRLLQLRRGIYVLAEPYRKTPANPLYLANHLVTPSYVSLQSALAWHDLIPEAVPMMTSVTTGRPQRLLTPLGSFSYRHVQPDWLRGFRTTEIDGQPVFLATPEKALLDLVLLTPGGDQPAFLRELRLQNLDRIDRRALATLAREADSPKLQRAVAVLTVLAAQDTWEAL